MAREAKLFSVTTSVLTTKNNSASQTKVFKISHKHLEEEKTVYTYLKLGKNAKNKNRWQVGFGQLRGLCRLLADTMAMNED